MKIINKKVVTLCESGHGPIEAKFAFINPENGETLTPFCKCKDYFSDLFWSNATGEKVNVYGFKWTPNEDKGILAKDRLFLAVKLIDRFGSKADIPITQEQLKGVQSFFNKFEKNLKFDLTKTSICEEGKHLIIEFSKEWTQRPYVISAFFLFIRLAFKYENTLKNPIEFYINRKTGEWLSPNDEHYFRAAKARMTDLFQGKIDKRQTFKQYETGNCIHNNSGIVNYTDYKIS